MSKMIIKDEIRLVRMEVRELIDSMDHEKAKECYEILQKNNNLPDITYNAMVYGAWKSLGKSINLVLESGLNNFMFDSSCYSDEAFNFDEAISTSHDLTEGFFNKLSNEVNHKIWQYWEKCLTDIKKINCE